MVEVSKKDIQHLLEMSRELETQLENMKDPLYDYDKIDKSVMCIETIMPELIRKLKKIGGI